MELIHSGKDTDAADIEEKMTSLGVLSVTTLCSAGMKFPPGLNLGSRGGIYSVRNMYSSESPRTFFFIFLRIPQDAHAS